MLGPCFPPRFCSSSSSHHSSCHLTAALWRSTSANRAAVFKQLHSFQLAAWAEAKQLTLTRTRSLGRMAALLSKLQHPQQQGGYTVMHIVIFANISLWFCLASPSVWLGCYCLQTCLLGSWGTCSSVGVLSLGCRRVTSSVVYLTTHTAVARVSTVAQQWSIRHHQLVGSPLSANLLHL